MQRILFCLFAICLTVSVSAQLSVGAGGNYTRFLGDYQTGTFGFHGRIQYEKGPFELGLQYTHHLPFQLFFYGPLDAPSSDPNSTDTKIDFRFQSIDLSLRRTILGNTGSKTRLYGGLGASWVFLAYKERYTNADHGTLMFPLEEGHSGSISINGLLGSEYRLGKIALYGEAVYSLPTKKRYIKQTINTLTPRLGFQLGLKIPLQ